MRRPATLAALVLWLLSPALTVLTTSHISNVADALQLLALSAAILLIPLLLLPGVRFYLLLMTPLAVLALPYCYLTRLFDSVPSDALLESAFNMPLARNWEMASSVGWVLLLVPASLCAWIFLVRSLPAGWRLGRQPQRALQLLVLCCVLEITLAHQRYWRDWNLPRLPAPAILNVSYPLGPLLAAERVLEQQTDTLPSASVHAASVQPEQPLLVMLVIGESLRPDHLGINGYQRNTTPHLAALGPELLSFHDVVSTANWTYAATRRLVQWQAGSRGSANIVASFREAGFHTAWLSSQEPMGVGGSAHVARYVGAWPAANDGRDIDLLPLLHANLRQGGRRQFVVLHLYNSHAPYDRRYRGESKVFTPTMSDAGTRRPGVADRNVVINSYDNTVVETDKFLAQVVATLRREQRPAVMLFTSDHGQNLFDNERHLYQHSQVGPTRFDLRVPLLVWANPAYRQAYPRQMAGLRDNVDKKVSHVQIFPTLLDMARIRWDGAGQESSFASPAYQQGRRLVHIDRLRMADFETIN